jgi:branched-chain amino acid transport system ATP-binding protein
MSAQAGHYQDMSHLAPLAAASTAAVLDAVELSAYYGRLCALHDASLRVNQGEIVVLVGANGAGKSTLLRSLSGAIHRTGGISFLGERIDNLEPENVVRRGLVHVPEGRKIFPGLTVRENLEVGGHAVGLSTIKIRSGVEDALQYFPRLAGRITSYGWSLSGGEQQMLAIGRGLMANPRMLMLDEPSLGLAPLVTQEVFSIIRSINQSGVPILLVEQNVRTALHFADRCYVMQAGHLVKEGKACEMLNDPDIVKAYLGG